MSGLSYVQNKRIIYLSIYLFDFYGHHLSISYRSQDNAGQNFEPQTDWRILTF